MNRKSWPMRLVVALFFVTLVTLIGVALAWWSMSSDQFLMLDAASSPTSEPATSTEGAYGQQPIADLSTQLIEQRRRDAQKALIEWAALSGAVTFAFTSFWLLLAASRERHIAGPRGQAAQRVAWVLLLTVNLISVGALSYFLESRPALLGQLESTLRYPAICVAMLTGLFGYWAGTIFGANPIVRPSIPLGHLNRR